MHTLSRDEVVYSLDKKHDPKLEVQDGQTITVETEDCFSHQITDDTAVLGEDFDYSKVNPATGPISIQGSQPGDVLKIHVEKIDLDDQGVTEAYPDWGPLGEEVNDSVTGVGDIAEDRVTLFGIDLPLRPMIGVIGVAPEGDGVPCGSPGSHGGNLDTLDITEGATVYLPVQVPGAKLALGDVHATMGDGEVCGTGIEARSEVKIKVEIDRNCSFTDPVVEKNEALYFVGSAKELSSAVRLSVKNAVEYIERNTDLSWEKSYMLASVGADLKISQAVNPLKTTRVKVPKYLLSSS